MSIWKKLFRRPAEKVTPDSYHWGYFTPERLKALKDMGVPSAQFKQFCSCKNPEFRNIPLFITSPNFGLLMSTCCNCGHVQFFSYDVLYSQYIPHPDDRVVEVKYDSSNASVK